MHPKEMTHSVTLVDECLMTTHETEEKANGSKEMNSQNTVFLRGDLDDAGWQSSLNRDQEIEGNSQRPGQDNLSYLGGHEEAPAEHCMPCRVNFENDWGSFFF